MVDANRSAAEWFLEAQRCYLEQHQGCAWCGGSHRVYKVQQGQRLLYYCIYCDFHAICNMDTNSYHFLPGDKEETLGKDTFVPTGTPRKNRKWLAV